YWTKTEGGWRWVSGFWAPAAQDGLDYLDEPPRSLENGPATDAPDEDAVYVPGNWMYRAGRYRWRQGFWLDPYREWVWIPGHYVWTPAGYVFIDGYWDYTLEDRGLLFAPVYFDQPLWTTPDWCYRPYYAVTLGGLFSSLWVRPAYCHYYFGDFYDPLYAGF